MDRRTLKALMEFRGLEGGNNLPAETEGTVGLAGTCRFCGARGNSGLLAIGNVCADHQCQVILDIVIIITLVHNL